MVVVFNRMAQLTLKSGENSYQLTVIAEQRCRLSRESEKVKDRRGQQSFGAVRKRMQLLSKIFHITIV